MGSADGGVRALQQDVCSQRETGWRQRRLFKIRHQKRNTGGKGCTNRQLIRDAPRTHPGLRYTAHACTSLSRFGATAAARGAGGTAATSPLLSPSQAVRGEGTTSQCRPSSRRHGLCHALVTRLRKHTMDINWTDLATVGPSVLPYISGPFPHPLNALHYLLHFI